MSLVADYSSCSDSDTETEVEAESEIGNSTKKCVSSKKLPSASFLLSGIQGEVFSNPYKQKETEKLEKLEHHVKMVNTTNDGNGRKICYNHRKGRCRFGSTCSYYHDSDLVTPDINKTQNIPKEESKVKDVAESSLVIEDVKSYETTVHKNKKRSGLGDSIVPSKKVMKAFYSQHGKKRSTV